MNKTWMPLNTFFSLCFTIFCVFFLFLNLKITFHFILATFFFILTFFVLFSFRSNNEWEVFPDLKKFSTKFGILCEIFLNLLFKSFFSFHQGDIFKGKFFFYVFDDEKQVFFLFAFDLHFINILICIKDTVTCL